MILAVFDVDHTVIKGDSAKWFGWFALKAGRINATQVYGFVKSSVRRVLGSATTGDVKASYFKMFLGGLDPVIMRSLMREFTAKVLIPGTRQLALSRIRWHQQQRHVVIFLSASPDLYLKTFADELGVDDLVCTTMADPSGDGFGELFGENCKGIEKLRRLSARYSNWQVDWPDSYGYGDSFDDRYFLETLGNPVVVNPDARLQRLAAAQGWKIEKWD